MFQKGEITDRSWFTSMADDFQKVAKLAEVPVGSTKIVKVGDVELFVANVEGSFYALLNKCTHFRRAVGTRETHR